MSRWARIRRGIGPLPPLTQGLEFFGDLRSPDTSVVSGAVATLGDSSGKGRHFTQVTGTRRPAYLACDPSMGGAPSMTFDGVDDYVRLATAYADANGGALCTVYIVIRGGTTGRPYAGDTNPSILFSKDSATVIRAVYYITSDTAKVVTVPAKAPVRLTAVYDTTVGATALPKFYVDGIDSMVSYVSTGASSGVIGSGAHAIGSNGSGGANFFDGTVTDVLVYSVQHTAAEVARIDEWLARRNGMAAPMPPMREGLQFFGDLKSVDTSIVTSAVATLGDRSGNARHFTQATAGNRPAYTAIDTLFGDQPSMTFDGIDDFLNRLTAFSAMTKATIYIVAKMPSWAANASLLSNGTYSAAGALTLFATSLTSIKGFFVNPGSTESSRTVTTPSGSVFRIGFAGDLAAGGTLWATYLGGSASGTNNASSATAGGALSVATASIGADSGGASGRFTGTITDVLVYSVQHNATQAALVDAWLAKRNGNMPPITDNMVFFGDLASPDTIIIDGAVSQLGDRSGNARHFTQGTASKRPTFTASDSLAGGRPSMTFDGTSDALVRALGLPAMANCTLYIAVRSITGSASSQRVVEISTLGSVGGLSVFVPASTSAIVGRYDATAVLTSTRDVPVVLAGVSRVAFAGALSAGGALWTSYLNGVATGTNGAVTASAGSNSGTTGSAIGAIWDGSSNYLAGTLVDIVAYSRVHTAAEVAVMDAWFQARYASNTPPITYGLEFWGDLSSPDTSIVSSAVATLGDSSGRGRHYTQATSTKRPAYTVADANFGNRPSMTFDGVDDFLSRIAPAFAAFSEITVYIVHKGATYASYEHLFAIDTTPNDGAVVFYLAGASTAFGARFDHPAGGSNLSTFGITGSASAAQRLAYSGSLASGGALWTGYLNGAASGTTTASLATAGGTSSVGAASIGAIPLGSQCIATAMTDILVFSRAHTAAEVALVDAWLKARNGL